MSERPSAARLAEINNVIEMLENYTPARSILERIAIELHGELAAVTRERDLYAAAIDRMVATIDRLTRERDEAERRLNMTRTLVEQAADDCARRGDRGGHILTLAIREIICNDGLDAAIAAMKSA